MFKIFVVILVPIILIRVYAQTDYCDRKLCYGKWTHVGCRALQKDKIPLKCQGEFAYVDMDQERIDLILHIHNRARDVVASGQHMLFDKAAKMGVVSWHPELESLAKLNINSCIPKVDTCRNTKEFPNVGQNVARTSWPEKQDEDIDDVIELQISEWFNQSKYVSMTDIRQLFPPKNFDAKRENISTFLQMVQERVKYIGCNVMRRTYKKYVHQSLCCNYSFKNLITKQVYQVSSIIGELCEEKHKNYTHLCTEDEEYLDLPKVLY